MLWSYAVEQQLAAGSLQRVPSLPATMCCSCAEMFLDPITAYTSSASANPDEKPVLESTNMESGTKYSAGPGCNVRASSCLEQLLTLNKGSRYTHTWQQA